ncbi:YceI family protein [Sporocytophaga myxococcoides]|uniref:YceI family protein n=1 Tax=Sporocytophaga myxococcoides TaxID=153721 RepID=UPI0003FC6629|nr:YceI family protein [Sporocytophaga myxococcoides]
MVKQLIFLFLASCLMLVRIELQAQTQSKVYKTSTGNISFYSETPIENIDAHSTAMSSAINPVNRNAAALVMINTFKFKNALMQEHFNEKYMESDKYPKATFSGIINENVDLMKPGNYNVTVTGKLTIHGVEQNRTINATITVSESLQLHLKADFNVKLVDHKIEIPEIVFHKIAEVIAVKIDADYSLK